MYHALVIEDDFFIAEHIAHLAERAGVTSSEIVDSEADAVRAASDHLPDLILSDVDLKRGGHGPTAVAAIRRDAGPIPVIFITGTPEACFPCDDSVAILEKPVSAERLIAAVSGAIAAA